MASLILCIIISHLLKCLCEEKKPNTYKKLQSKIHLKTLSHKIQIYKFKTFVFIRIFNYVIYTHTHTLT